MVRKQISLFLFTGLFFFTVACSTEIVHRLPERDANDTVALLREYGIQARKKLEDAEKNLWTVIVPKGQEGDAWLILKEHRMPPAPKRGFKDVFGKSKLVVTPLEEKALYLEALQGEIATSLQSLNGVIDAYVHLVLPDTDISGQPIGEAKASVLVLYRTPHGGGAPILPEEVKKLVAHAVANLRPENVDVIMKPIAVASGTEAQETPANLVTLGPFTMTNESVTALKISVGVLFLLFAIFGGLLYVSGKENMRLRNQLMMKDREIRALKSASQSSKKVS